MHPTQPTSFDDLATQYLGEESDDFDSLAENYLGDDVLYPQSTFTGNKIFG